MTKDMKTTKYIFLALLAALLMVPTIGRAQNSNTLNVEATGTILGLDCSVAANKTAIESLLFTSTSVSATDDGTQYTFELQCNTNIIPANVQLGTLTVNGGATQIGTPTQETTAGGKIVIVIDNAAADLTVHTIEVTGYTPHTFSLTLSDPEMSTATEQKVNLTVEDQVVSSLTYTETSTPSINDLFVVSGFTSGSTPAQRNVMVSGKEGTIYYGSTDNKDWDNFTQVKLPAYDWDGDNTGVITNEADYTPKKSYGHTDALTVPFTFASPYYGKLATFTFANEFDASAITPDAATFDIGSNTWTFTLPDAARATISNATFTVTKRDVNDALVTAELTGYDSKDGDVYVYEYTGADITPGITITDTERTYDLVLSTDYNALDDVTKQAPGLYTITLQGTGYNYTGWRPIQWRIVKNINHSDFTVTVDPAVYTGTEFTLTDLKSKVIVKHQGTELTEGTDYDLTFKTGHQPFIDAKTYVEELVITGRIAAGISGTRYADFTIKPKDIAATTITAEAAYTGSAIDPAENDGATPPTYSFIKVEDGTTTLTATEDYTVAVAAGTYQNAGTYDNAVTITAVDGSNYTGSKVVPFVITGGTSMDAAAITITVDPVVYKGAEYTLDEVKAKVVVKNGTTKLVEGTDYILTKISTYIDAKTYTNDIIITGNGEYYGTRTADFIVQPKPITLCDVTAGTTYTGSDIDPAKNDGATPPVYDFITVKDGATTLTATVDYTVTVATGTYKDAGTYADAITITAVDGGNYTGFQVVDFVIDHAGFDVAKALVEAKDVYTGAALPPVATNPAEPTDNIVVKLGDKTLVYGTDYTFVKNEADANYLEAKTYENAITITGIGEYYGTLNAAYVIQPRAFADADITITVPDLNYDATDLTPVPEVKYQTNVVDPNNYTFTPATVKEAGTYTLSFEGQYSLTGTNTAEVKVLKAMDGAYTDDFVITIVPETPIAFDGTNPVEPEIKVTDNGKELVEGTDYTVAYSNNTAEGEGTVTITGAGVYSGTKSINFPIVAAYFTEGDFTYHYINSTTVAVGTETHDVATTSTDPNITVPDVVNHTIGSTPYPFTVVGVETGAFKDLTTMFTLTLPATIEYIEDKAFEGCAALRWIDASTATALVPSSLDRTIEATPFYGVPAQALVFLTDNKVEGENYVYMVGAADFRCDVFKIFDDVSGKQTTFTQTDGYQWAYENPYEFKANTVVNTRQLSGEQHYTTCLPYTMAIPTGVKAYQLVASTDPAINSASTLIGFTEVTGNLEAFKPYVLIPTVSGQLLCAGETTIPATVGVFDDTDGHHLNKVPATATAGGYVMYGTMRFKAGDGKQYIMQEKNEWKLTDGAGWSGGTGACVLPMRAYIAKEGEYPVKKFLTATYGTTELNELFDQLVEEENADRYDIAGRKVSGNLRKGIYVVNGKKVVMGK